MTRFGVFGSAFNPPQIGHLILVAEARWRLGLDRIIVVPTGDPYHKDSDRSPAPEARLQLARDAFSGQDGVDVSDIEVMRPGPSYTCETLEAISQQDPDSELYLLLGADSAAGIGAWHRLDRILELARLAVAPRGRVELQRIERAVADAGGTSRLEFFAMPEVGISSTLVRSRIESGEPYEHLVPAAVAGTIRENELYAG